MALILSNGLSAIATLLEANQILELGSNRCDIDTCTKNSTIQINGGPFTAFVVNTTEMNTITVAFETSATYKCLYGIKDGVATSIATANGTYNVSGYDYIAQHQCGNISSASMSFTWAT